MMPMSKRSFKPRACESQKGMNEKNHFKIMGEAERQTMEKQATARFSIHFIEWFHPKKHQGFIVNLRNPLTEEEIAERMMQGFGDL